MISTHRRLYVRTFLSLDTAVSVDRANAASGKKLITLENGNKGHGGDLRHEGCSSVCRESYLQLAQKQSTRSSELVFVSWAISAAEATAPSSRSPPFIEETVEYDEEEAAAGLSSWPVGADEDHVLMQERVGISSSDVWLHYSCLNGATDKTRLYDVWPTSQAS
jgi:hypothetical protein